MKTMLGLIISSALVGCSMNHTSPLTESPAYQVEAKRNEAFRPQVHFSPAEKWMNDPNGMFYLDGEYHLFFQHNPDASVWGPMHWGHAVSKDLVHWEEQPIALYPDELGTIFSGSAVVDWNNSSGFGTKENPPIVALYTYHNAEMEKQGVINFQTQALAYSLDKGKTWKKYSGNPVIENPGIKDFRDPKVMWHEPSKKWVMVLAQKDHIGFYSSDNLIDWSLESTFGEEVGSHGGVWECPELLLMPVEGTNQSRYVLLVSISPGGPNGGSATQYFVGDFDGSNFVLDSEWQSELAPIPAQFPTGTVFDDFESGADKWSSKGDAFATAPTAGGHPSQPSPTGFSGTSLVNSFAEEDRATGTLTSEAFTIVERFINFKIGGGNHPDKVGIQLVVEGNVVKSETGLNRETLHYASWDVSQWQGKSAFLRIIDKETEGWGHTYIDDIVFAKAPALNRIEPAIWLDHGTDNYAGVTFFNSPESEENRHIFMGWMSNWLYANDVPTEKWRSAMTLPRSLQLVETDEGLRVRSQLVEEVDSLVEASIEASTLASGETISLSAVDKANRESALRYAFEVQGKATSPVSIRLENENGEYVDIEIDQQQSTVLLGRSNSGETAFNKQFSDKQKGALTTTGDVFNVTVVIDRSSLELFIDDGTTVMTSLIFPETVYNTMRVRPNSQSLHQISIERLSSVWSSR
ncbi:levanase [Alteromonas mediterranea]|uniref:glycoside hydrolase family 32 protein n=1 Tax=Alteromonas mediterranea TaxID=314275 RepID=UPI00090400AB|nr:glycoside hydrolase family 32 protein [Alteromonas mediterranea]APD95457.1 levanase [Alteromonas mediterranea]APD99091.1 levanase [Alteromonas mediterranea]